MKTILQTAALVCLFLLAVDTEAAKYYFSSKSGDDSRTSIQAQNPDTPWKSIEKLNAIFKSLKPGDEILFKRNEVFYGSINLTASGSSGKPISFGAYGSGAKPVISALVSLNKWSPAGNGIYESQSPLLADELNVVLVGGKIQEMGRFPNSDAANSGYLTIESTNKSNSVTNSKLQGGTNWKGAEVVIRKSHFTIDRHAVESHSGNSIQYTKTANTYNPNVGYGFFIQGHVGTLDKYGEWYYDPKSKKLRVYFGTQDPSAIKVQASTMGHLVTNAMSMGHFVFDNLHFVGANKHTFYLHHSQNVTVRNVDIECSGENAFYIHNLPNFTLENSTINYSNNGGVQLAQNTPNAKIVNNKVNNTNTIPGLGKSGVGSGYAIEAASDQGLIQYNEIVNTGYIGIRFGGNNTQVLNNYVDNFCLLKDDGAGIYTWTGSANQEFKGRKVVGNIVLNGTGAKNGTPLQGTLQSPAADGIYLDDNASGVEIVDNTVGNMAGSGMYVHNARNIVIKNNTFFNNNVQLNITHDNLGNPVRNAAITGNVFFAKSSDQLAASISTIKNDIREMGNFDGNYYARPADDLLSISTRYVDNGKNVTVAYDLEGWQATFGKDKSSKRSPLAVPLVNIKRMANVNLYPNGTYDTKATTTQGLHGNNSEISWVAEGKLDKGALQVKTKGNSSSVTIKVGTLRASSSYVLRFSALASKDAVVRALLMQSNAPYAMVSTKIPLKLNKTRREYEVVFPIAKEELQASLRFEAETGDLTYWLDNVVLQEAETTPTDLNKHIRFAYNPTKDNKNISLDGTYVDVQSGSYSGSITLPPFSSKVLIRKDAMLSDGSTIIAPVVTPVTAPVSAADKVPQPEKAVAVTAPAAPAAGFSLYLNTGSDKDVTVDGEVFKGDRSYKGYFNDSHEAANIQASKNPLFQTERNAQALQYTIPVPNGVYTVKTYHNEQWWGKSGPAASKGRRVFDIHLEGKLVKDDFDIFAENNNKETVHTFENIEVRDGKLNLQMTASKDRASISGIAIIGSKEGQVKAEQPRSPQTNFSIYLNTGSEKNITVDGKVFKGDKSFKNYFSSSHEAANPQASQNPLFQTERNAHTLQYTIPVPNGVYTVRTYHNEQWWGKGGPAASRGRRVFDIHLEGKLVKDDFDIFAENQNKETVLTFRNIEVKDGKLNIEMKASKDRASVSGIAIEGMSAASAQAETGSMSGGGISAAESSTGQQ